MNYTLNTDFSSLNGPKATNWIMGFQDMAEDAFADSSSHLRLLGNLLILEHLEGKKAVSDFQDFANNLYEEYAAKLLAV